MNGKNSGGQVLSLLARLDDRIFAGPGAGAVAGLTVTVVDLYLTGHGYGSLLREVITWKSVGAHLGIGDLGMLMAVIVTTTLTWHLATHGA